MALTISSTLLNGVTATYLRISQVENKNVLNGSNFPMKTIISVEYWLDQATRDLAKEGKSATLLSGENIQSDSVFSDIQSVYIYLKTLPQFKGAVDC